MKKAFALDESLLLIVLATSLGVAIGRPLLTFRIPGGLFLRRWRISERLERVEGIVDALAINFAPARSNLDFLGYDARLQNDCTEATVSGESTRPNHRMDIPHCEIHDVLACFSEESMFGTVVGGRGEYSMVT